MPEYNTVFYAIFLSQVLLISVYVPRQLLSRVRHVIEKYPPSTYPKLYPVPVNVVEKGLRTYRIVNLPILLIGLLLVLVGVFSPSEEMLRWDSQSVLMFYFLLQVCPLMLVERSGFKYFRLMRKANSRTTRKAELHPRRLFDFVSPTLVSMAIFSYIVVILLVLYVIRHPFPGFAGPINIVMITAVNLLFAGVVVKNLYGKRGDPHQAHADRLKGIAIAVKMMVVTSIVVNVFLAIVFVLPALNLRDLGDLFQMLFFQLCVVIGSRTLRIDNIDFEVYKDDPLVA